MASHVSIRISVTLVCIVAAILLIASPQQASAQAVQAVKHIHTSQAIYSEQQIAELTEAVHNEVQSLIALKEDIRRSGTDEMQGLEPELSGLIQQGLQVLSGSRESGLFEDRYLGLREDHRAFKEKWNLIAKYGDWGYQWTPEMMSANRVRRLPLPVSQSTESPGVTFTLGLSQYIAKDFRSVNSVDINTSLFGDVVGSVFGFFGSATLQRYFSQNLAVGASIPTHGENKVASVIGVGLGELHQSGLRIWPAVGMQQFNRNDRRFSGDLATALPEEEEWSAPTLTIAFAPERSISAISQSRVGPIFTFGIQFQQYYPGNAFSAVGALFTEDISKYEKSGNVGFSFGIAVPIVDLKR